MGIISILASTASKAPIVGKYLQHKGVNSVFTGSLSAVGVTVGLATGYYAYGQTHGVGTAFVYAALSYNPYTGPFVMLAEAGYAIGTAAMKSQRQKRKSSFTKGISDNYGTINKMKMFSIQQLSKDHSSRMRFIGNEARFLHR